MGQTHLPGQGGVDVRRTICDICCPSFHCGVDAYVKDGRVVKIEGTADHPTNHGLLCAKGLAARQYLYSPDRIRTPLRRVGARGEGKFEPISWEEAYCEIASRLLAIRAESGAESVVFASGYSKWYRPYLHRFSIAFGSPNYMTESSNCMFSTFLNWLVTTGNPMCANDLSRTGVFLGWAYNPYHSRGLAALSVERRKKEGMKVIIVDPRVTPASERLADLHLRPRSGTDGALALGLANLLIARGAADEQYIKNYVHGYDEFCAYVRDFTPARVEELTGVPEAQLHAAASMIAENLPLAISESAAPLAHHKNGFQNYRAVMALSAITGCFDRPGGQIPVQFTYNYLGAGFSAREQAFIHEFDSRVTAEPVGAARFPLWSAFIDEAQANDLPRQIRESRPYPIRAMLGFGYNYRIAPDDAAMREALLSLDFLVNTDLFLTDTCKLCDIVLPACTSFERSELKTYSGGNVLLTKPVVAPLYESRDDVTILCSLARAMELHDPLLEAGPDACIDFILRDQSVTAAQLRAADGFVRVPVEPYVPGTMLARGLATASGKFELYSEAIARIPGLDPLPTYTPPEARSAEFPYLLSSSPRIPGALHSRLHRVPWARSLRPEPLCGLHPDDAAALGITQGGRMELRSPAGVLTVRANVTAAARRGEVNLYQDYPECDVNAIVPPGHLDPYSGFGAYREIPVSIRRLEDGNDPV